MSSWWKKALVSLLFIFPMAVLVTVAVVFYQGWALWRLWNWHLVPLGAPAIDFIPAAAICLIVLLLQHPWDPLMMDRLQEKGETQYWGFMTTITLKPVIVVCVGDILLRLGGK